MKNVFHNILKIFCALILLLTIAIVIIFHSPYTTLKDLWVTTSMKTYTHQYLAKIFVSDKEINEIMNRNKVIEPSQKINLNNINTDGINKLNSVCSLDELEGVCSLSDDGTYYTTHNNSTEKIDISGTGYTGKLIIVKDPSRIFVGVSDHLGNFGEKLLDMTKSYEAVAGINAGGFSDANGNGNGGIADGLIISNSKILKLPSSGIISLVGFNEDNKLIIGSYSIEEIKNMNIRDAISFSPALIINGKPTEIIGDGGWGIQPRTAIGQRKDGSVLLLVVDGRQVGSIGITIKTLQDIMVQYGAENATNLDGGSSTTMIYNNEIINHPCSPYGPRYLPDAFLIKGISSDITTTAEN